jgi:hypothetical protein
MKMRTYALVGTLLVVASIGWWLLDEGSMVEPSARPNSTEAAESPMPTASTRGTALLVADTGEIDAAAAAGEQSISPTELIARAPNAAAAIAGLRSMEPSKDVADALVVASAACAESARTLAADGPWKTLTTSWDKRHQEQISRFLTWCGDLDTLRLARIEAVRKSALGVPGDSDQDRAQALLDDETGLLAPEHQDAALALLFETTSLAVADGLASGLLHLATNSAAGSQQSTLIGDHVRPTSAAFLASAMIYCRNSALCAPNHPRTMLDCIGSGLCAADRRLIDFRYAMANSFERELAENLVADWTRRRHGTPGGS